MGRRFETLAEVDGALAAFGGSDGLMLDLQSQFGEVAMGIGVDLTEDPANRGNILLVLDADECGGDGHKLAGRIEGYLQSKPGFPQDVGLSFEIKPIATIL